MKKEELEELEQILHDEYSRRRKLGGYSAEAEGLLILSEALFKITCHLNDNYPKKK